MVVVRSLLFFAHLIGLALGVGSATVKLTLLLRCNADHGFAPCFIRVAKPITRLLVLGIVLMTLSGIVMMFVPGYPLTPRLAAKLVLVGVMWILGPIIDNVVEPRFQRLVPASGESASPAFIRIQKQFLTLEAIATGQFYVIIAIWVAG